MLINVKKRLSDEEIRRRIDFISTHTVEESAEYIGITTYGILSFCYDYNVSPIRVLKNPELIKKERDEKKRLLIEERRKFAENHTLCECAEEWGVEYRTAWSFCKNNRVLTTDEFCCYDKGVLIEKRRKFAENHTLKECAEEWCIGYSSAQNYCKKHKFNFKRETCFGKS